MVRANLSYLNTITSRQDEPFQYYPSKYQTAFMMFYSPLSLVMMKIIFIRSLKFIKQFTCRWTHVMYFLLIQSLSNFWWKLFRLPGWLTWLYMLIQNCSCFTLLKKSTSPTCIVLRVDKVCVFRCIIVFVSENEMSMVRSLRGGELF